MAHVESETSQSVGVVVAVGVTAGLEETSDAVRRRNAERIVLWENMMGSAQKSMAATQGINGLGGEVQHHCGEYSKLYLSISLASNLASTRAPLLRNIRSVLYMITWSVTR